jgi:hypothetical protein
MNVLATIGQLCDERSLESNFENLIFCSLATLQHIIDSVVNTFLRKSTPKIFLVVFKSHNDELWIDLKFDQFLLSSDLSVYIIDS